MKTAIADQIDALLGDDEDEGWCRPLDGIQEGLQRAVHAHFGMPDPGNDDNRPIKWADLQALEIERSQIMAPCTRPWAPLPQTEKPPTLVERKPESVQMDFRLRLEALLVANKLPTCRDLWGSKP